MTFPGKPVTFENLLAVVLDACKTYDSSNTSNSTNSACSASCSTTLFGPHGWVGTLSANNLITDAEQQIFPMDLFHLIKKALTRWLGGWDEHASLKPILLKQLIVQFSLMEGKSYPLNEQGAIAYLNDLKPFVPKMTLTPAQKISVNKAKDKLNRKGCGSSKIHGILNRNPDSADKIATIICNLKDASLLNEQTLNLVFANAQYANQLWYAVFQLRSKHLLSLNLFELLCQQVGNAHEIFHSLGTLEVMDILTEENIAVLIQCFPYGAGDIALLLTRLKEAGILENDTRKLLLQNASHASQITTAIYILKKGHLTKDNFQFLCECVEFKLKNIAWILLWLSDDNLLNTYFRRQLKEKGQYSGKLESGFSSLAPCKMLHKTSLLNTKTAELLFQHAPHADRLGNAIRILDNVNLLNDESLNVLIANVTHIPLILLSRLACEKILDQNLFTKVMNEPMFATDDVEKALKEINLDISLTKELVETWLEPVSERSISKENVLIHQIGMVSRNMSCATGQQRL